MRRWFPNPIDLLTVTRYRRGRTVAAVIDIVAVEHRLMAILIFATSKIPHGSCVPSSSDGRIGSQNSFMLRS